MKPIIVIKDPEAIQIIADETRRKIVFLLRVKEMTVSQIAADLKLSPQAIYHHIRKMLEAGLIEVAKEERVEHFIETYYQATAEIFQFNYGEESNKEYSEARTKEALDALNRIGLILPMDDDTVSKFSLIRGKINSIYQRCSLDPSEKISQIDGLDSFTKQDAIEIACKISMSDQQFEEMQMHPVAKDPIRIAETEGDQVIEVYQGDFRLLRHVLPERPALSAIDLFDKKDRDATATVIKEWQENVGGIAFIP